MIKVISTDYILFEQTVFVVVSYLCCDFIFVDEFR